MKVVINKPDYGDISTAVFYSSSVFPCKGGERDMFKSTGIQYHASREGKGMPLDFSEYDFKYILEKYKFNDTYILGYLGEKSRGIVGKNISDLEKLSTTFFPTNTTREERPGDYGFFGSAIVENQNFFMFDVPEGVMKIELFENILEGNEFIDFDWKLLNDESYEYSPVVTIYLGPDKEDIRNPESYYLSLDPLRNPKNRKTVSPTILDYQKLVDERAYRKIVWLMSSMDSTISTINFSYKSWVMSNNPQRNKNTYTLRGDEWYQMGKGKYVSQLEDTEQGWIRDISSGWVLGTEEVTSHPIYDRKLRSLSLSVWSPSVVYQPGDIVKHSDISFECVSPECIGKDPFVSPEWVKSGWAKNRYTTRISIIPYPIEGGSIIPGGEVTITSSTDRRTFNVYEKTGYSLASKDPVLSEIGQPIASGSYRIQLAESEGILTKRVIVTDWQDSISTGKLVFNFSKVMGIIGCSIKEIAENTKFIDITQPYVDVAGYGVSLEKMEIDGVQVDWTDPEKGTISDIEVPLDSKVKLYFKIPNADWEISKVSVYNVNPDPVNKTYTYVEDIPYTIDGEYIVIEDTYDYQSSRDPQFYPSYTILIKRKKITNTFSTYNPNLVEFENLVTSVELGQGMINKFYIVNPELWVFDGLFITDQNGKPIRTVDPEEVGLEGFKLYGETKAQLIYDVPEDMYKFVIFDKPGCQMSINILVKLREK